jgi:nitrate reductase NapE component
MSNNKSQAQLQQLSAQFLRFRIVLFLLLVALVYGFVVWRIDALKNAPPTPSAVASKLQSTTHIDQATINKVQQLQDNSVSVQTLFNQARQNPFHE